MARSVNSRRIRIAAGLQPARGLLPSQTSRGESSKRFVPARSASKGAISLFRNGMEFYESTPCWRYGLARSPILDRKKCNQMAQRINSFHILVAAGLQPARGLLPSKTSRGESSRRDATSHNAHPPPASQRPATSESPCQSLLVAGVSDPGSLTIEVRLPTGLTEASNIRKSVPFANRPLLRRLRQELAVDGRGIPYLRRLVRTPGENPRAVRAERDRIYTT